ncbi:MAG: flagellar basal-body MS-ring/collar protein FliF [Candidatus Margulisiibacteriota bacterium]
MGSAVGGTEARRLMIMATVVVVIGLISVLGFLRSCGIRDPYAGYVVIFSNLELKDSADVVAQLKEQKVLYQIRDGGTAIAVPKDKADEARLALAQKNLPLGGSVGWEIFNESKLGTTDFDRRIQFVRAISGELARTIKKIDGVQDARVQIVIPQTTLFEVNQVPVTASVLLQLKTGRRIAREQVNGIVNLVSHSVENLRPENVSIVDVFGNILTGPEAITPEATVVAPIFPAEKENRFEVIKQKAPEIEKFVPTKEVELITPKPLLRTHEEKALAALKAKEEMENKLSSKAQTIVNRFYPPNSILVKVNLEIEDYEAPGARKKNAAASNKTETELLNESIKKMMVIILVDNRFNLTKQLKKTTTDMVASALPYYSLRGDKIVIRQVPFHYATAASVGAPGSIATRESGQQTSSITALLKGINPKVSRIVFRLVAGLLIFVILVRIFRRKKRRKPQAAPAGKTVPLQKNAAVPSAVDQVRNAVSRSPEKVAKLIEKWLTEEEERKQ